jgi:hypothetical protein
VNWSSIVAAFKAGAWKSWLGFALSTAATFGVLDSQQVTAANNLVGAIVALMTAAMAVAHTSHVVKLATKATACRVANPPAERIP